MRFNKKLFLIFLMILLLEIIIALFVRDRFIRPFIGDVLVILLIFFFIRAFIPIQDPKKLSAGIFLFACLVEIGQYFNLIEILNLQNSVFLSIVLGSTFDWMDILAYATGALASATIKTDIKQPTT